MASQPNPPGHFQTRILPSNGERIHNNPAAGELGFQFFNTMYRTLIVATRTGVRFEVPRQPVAVNRNPGITVRVRVIAQHGVNLDVSGLSNDQGVGKPSAEANAFIQAVDGATQNSHGRTARTAYVDYHIPEEDFDRSGGLLYAQNLDLVLSVLPAATTPHHPYSIAGQRDRDAYAFNETKAVGSLYGLYIRDRSGHYGARFININGEVYRVPVERDGMDRDGVYRICNGRTSSDFAVERTSVEYFSFEEADAPLGLYPTYNLAVVLGNPQEKNKRDIEAATHALRMAEMDSKAEAQRADSLFTREKEAMRLHAAQREHLLRLIEINQREIDLLLERRDSNFRRDMMLLKELSERRGYTQRETMEILKMIPMLLTTSLALVVAIQKLRST